MLLLLLVILPSTGALVTCRVACAQCKDKSTARALREVYCAMCRECLTHERRRLLTEQDYGWDEEVEEPPPGCPTAPPCSDEEIQPTMKKEEEISTTTTTTTRPTTTPPPATCPPIIPCRKKKPLVAVNPYPQTQPNVMPMYQGCFMPFMPMMQMQPCPTPGPVQTTAATPSEEEVPLKATKKVPKKKDFFYVYIGLPKDAVNAIDE